MQGEYIVTRAGQAVGRVRLIREGLYYRIFCRCDLADGEIHRLYAGGENLGVLIPDRGELTLESKVAAKRLKPGCAFSLDENRREFIPIHPGEAFPCLEKVRQSKLAFREGEPGLFME